MKVSATLRYLRVAPRKVRLVADLIRGKRAQDGQNILNFTRKGAATPMLKLLNSALANAKNNFQLEPINLYIAKIEVNEGPKLKRWRARARGQAAAIQKKTSHISIILDEIRGAPKKSKIQKKAVPTASAEETEKNPEPENRPKIEKPKFRAKSEAAKMKPQAGMKRFFRRKTV